MAGYILRNTLSEFGHVARAVCRTTADHCLADARELLKIQLFPDGVKHTEDGETWLPLDPESIVSLNFWGFTTSLFDELEARFPRFLEERRADLLKAEFLIPEVVGALVREGKARVAVLPVSERWHGVTYPEDKARVQAAVRELIAAGNLSRQALVARSPGPAGSPREGRRRGKHRPGTIGPPSSPSSRLLPR